MDKPTSLTQRQPSYWDEPLDAGHFSTSPIFHPTLGFGSEGSGPGNCLPDGPFAEYEVNVGPGFNLVSRCVNRKINDTASLEVADRYVERALEGGTYVEVSMGIYMGPREYFIFLITI